MNPVKPTFHELLRDPVLALAFGFGTGLAPRAPGTFGTLVALPVFWLLSDQPLWLYLAVTLAISVSGIWICGYASAKLGVHDHGGIVWDELAGCLIAFIPLLLLPSPWPLWVGLMLGFGLFRLFDIAKPWPISWLDARVGGGGGIMVDDLLAGVDAALVLGLLLYFG